jgi:hypothetical protein
MDPRQKCKKVEGEYLSLPDYIHKYIKSDIISCLLGFAYDQEIRVIAKDIILEVKKSSKRL